MNEGLDEFPEVRQLTAGQRRILGALLEKAKTTPEYYPMTLKGLTTACNQKNNRDPVVEYEEGFVEDTLDDLQKIGLTGSIHSDSGRALRYRHFFRKRYEFTEPQVAIMTELLLRGRQTLGELRTRASRMEPIEDLDSLRREVRDLVKRNYVWASGSLDSRGVEVDHTFYLPNESPQRQSTGSSSRESEVGRASSSDGASYSKTSSTLIDSLQEEVVRLNEAHQVLREEVLVLRSTVERLTDRLDKLAADLGVS